MAEGEIQVLVVGGGIGGLSLAGFLQRAGVDPVVVERAEGRPDRPGVVELWPDAVRLLSRLDVGRKVRDAGVDVTRWARRRPDGTVAERLTASDEFGFLAVDYARLLTVLRGAVADGTVHEGSTLRSLDPGRGSVAVELANGVREQFDVVIGADGVRSRTREVLGGDGATFCGTTSVAFPLPDGVELGAAGEVWTADGAVFRAVPNGHGGAAWLTVPSKVPGQGVDDAGALAGLCPTVDWLLPEAAEAVDAGDLWWADDFRVPTDEWVDGRVALLGDAAHARHRLTGVGATLAIEDAAVLAAELVGGDDAPAARLADYAARRRSRLDRPDAGARAGAPLAGIESELAERHPAIPAVRGGRLAACFGGDPPTPATALGGSDGERSSGDRGR
ncbi:FAD-dependent oxidoreductase [Natronomonas marina]|jgi:2-polyprenyl-6-methoxyphenol hydroxylase-like FAD-dependent oxidoreductase|uniref:FAD-dependent oxidoreductase n=1 Tax=Natronomonas marina TaxID=2961939 RepID=UPI0020CA1ABC|nr:NAD(P)/FAD-dependent oxidoreductase [Natronomonas marina]